MTLKYHLELYETLELDDKDKTWYQELIGILRWETELGRVDILHKVSKLSQYQFSPREGHMREFLKILVFFRSNPKLTLYFDPSFPNLDYD